MSRLGFRFRFFRQDVLSIQKSHLNLSSQFYMTFRPVVLELFTGYVVAGGMLSKRWRDQLEYLHPSYLIFQDPWLIDVQAAQVNIRLMDIILHDPEHAITPEIPSFSLVSHNLNSLKGFIWAILRMMGRSWS